MQTRAVHSGPRFVSRTNRGLLHLEPRELFLGTFAAPDRTTDPRPYGVSVRIEASWGQRRVVWEAAAKIGRQVPIKIQDREPVYVNKF
jgi:hypothetical protein